MAYRIVHCRWESGERYCMLVDAETELPPWYPMLYVTTQLRNRGKAVATMEAALGAIELLLEHTEAKNIDLEKRLLKREFLATHEMDALCDQAQRTKGTKKRAKGSNTVSVGHHYKRLSWIANYIEWFAREVVDNRRTSEDNKAIEEMVLGIRSRRPDWNRKSKKGDRGLSDEQFDRVMEIIDPSHRDNPFTDERTAIRNQLAILMLAQLGVRKGELLGVQVRDIDWADKTLAIVRRQDDKYEPRAREPRAKTLPRSLPLSPELLRYLQQYVMGARRHTRGANAHTRLLVVHRKGPYEGQPLSEKGLDKALKKFGISELLLEKLHAHAFRHTWNWHFSRTMDEMPEDKRPSAEEQEAMRSELMGWEPGSGTAADYNRRFIESKAKEAELALAESVTKRNDE